MNNAAYRQSYRAEIPAWYSGYWHLMLTLGLSLAAIYWCASQLDGVTYWQWLALPLTFVYANLAEYLGHRYVMHVSRRGLRLIYQRHSKQHHRFFTDKYMPIDGYQDYRAVLFPLLLVVFFFGAFGAPMWLFLAWCFSTNVAWLALLTGIAYFLNYELFHFAYHCPKESWVLRLPGFRRLQALHLNHHNPEHEQMTKYNFNITYPIGDWLFGTHRK